MDKIIPQNIKNSKLEEALRLAGSGRFIIAVNQEKKPFDKGWPEKATTDEKTIFDRFSTSNPPNIGVVTGPKSGVLCLDVDAPEGMASLEALERQYGHLGRSCQAKTPSGGFHLFFQMPPENIRNSAGKLGLGLDIRANGGYVVVPPSRVINRSGELKNYEWLTEITLTTGQLPPAPPWLIELCLSPPKSFTKDKIKNKTKDYTATTAYGQKALGEECEQIANAPQGSRNETLNKSAFAIFQLVSGGAIDQAEAEAGLLSAATRAGLGDREIQATINSARSQAVHSPRTRSEPTQARVQPEQITVTFNEAPPPPLDVFPPKIQKMLKEAAVAFKQLPIEVPIVALLTLISACLGQSRVLKVKENWEEAGNLYMALVATSGLGKSPCFKEFLKPLWQEELRNKERWDVEMASYKAVLEEHSRQKNRLELSAPPPKPMRTQYIIEDATTEAIGSILGENPRGLLWYSDELSSIILNLDRYSGSKSGNKARLLSTYDRSHWKTSRRDQDKEQVIPSASLSIVGTVQPKILNELFGQTDALSGFLPRFIFILAKREAPGLLNNEIFTGQEILEKITQHLLSWKMDRRDGQWFPKKIDLTPDAYVLYEAWHNQVVREAWQGTEVDNAIAAKLVTQVIRLALLLHSLQAAGEGTDGLSDLDTDTMERAIKLGWWIRENQKRIWQVLSIQSETVKSPVEVAIIEAILSVENDLVANQWRMTNDNFNKLVTSKLGRAVEVSLLGREASRLGIEQCTLGKKRGKLFSPELIDSFKRKMYL